MKCKFLHICIGILLLATTASVSFAEVEWTITNTLKIDGTPLDMTVSPDGRFIYVLTEDGNIHIYTAKGTLKDTLNVGQQVDRIKLGPKGENLFISSRQNKTLKVITLDFLYDINISGSPTQGADNAPVVIAVFSDFQ
jgi:DNA-binding beta-propeller fold protein YncE